METGKQKIIGVGREIMGLRKDGTQFPFLLSVSEIDFGDRKIFAGLIHDLTQQKEAEKHRYLYFLGNKKENKLFMNILKHPLLPYPKGTSNKAEVTKHEVNNKGFYE